MKTQCAIAGHFPALEPTPRPTGCSLPERDAKDPSRQKPTAPPGLFGKKASWKRLRATT